MKKRFAGIYSFLTILLVVLLLLFPVLAQSQTISEFRYGIATPYLYTCSTSTGVPGTYYLAPPTLTANDTFVGLTTTQTLTNKTLTLPVIASFYQDATKVILVSVPTHLTTGGTLLLSPAAKDASAAVWLDASGNIVFEGATQDSYETTIAVTDPTADNTITYPDGTGTVALDCSVNYSYGSGHADKTLTKQEAQCNSLSVSGGDASANLILPSCVTGKVYVVKNGLATGGAVLTFKVTGQSGGTIAKDKYALYVCKGTDVEEIIEQP